MLRLTLPIVVIAAALAPAAPAPAPKPIELFNGKDLSGWKPRDEKKNAWVVGIATFNSEVDPKGLVVTPSAATGELINNQSSTMPSSDLCTGGKFTDVVVELEFMIPKGSNSGVYLMGEYEVQIYDTYGKPNDKLGPGDMGGIYKTAAPKVNAQKKPGEWQKFVIDFQAPTFEGDKKLTNGKFIKVTFNDQVIHENVEVKGSTGGGLTGKEVPSGPLMLQGDHGPVAFRNIKITPKK